MLSTIKSKIIVLTISVFVALAFIMSISACRNLKIYKKLMTKGCDYAISSYAQQVNKEISKLENNALDLALFGENYYKTTRNQAVSEDIIVKMFEFYENSLGGGIWFEPYKISPQKKLSRIYVYHKKDNTIEIDRISDNLNYTQESWYTEIKPKLSKAKIAWSKPYVDNRGSMALMTTVGAGIYDNQNNFIGMSTVDWEISSIVETFSKMKLTKNSFALFADKNNDYVLLSTDKYIQSSTLLGKSLKEIPWYNKNIKDGTKFNYHNTKYISCLKTLDNGMIFVINVPENELFAYIINQTIMIFISLIGASILIATLIYFVLKRNINKPIDELIKIANKIGQGDLDTEIKIDKPKEFANLASVFNKMTQDIKNNISNLNKVTKEKEKMESELSIARAIQYSALPATFYPTMLELNIYANMVTAKEVGGDFYDFFFINPTQFLFLIADVSGKGIPAALFMMTTKTLIKNIANENYPPNVMIEKINKQIYENNQQGFFVTMFVGLIDISTGVISYINCGHNPPLIKKANGKYEYLNIESNIILGIKGNFKYSIQESQMEKGDIIFLYTDGVTEALNENDKLYGEERLQIQLNNENNINEENLETLIENIKTDIKEYRGTAEQSDDITMLAFKYNGGVEQKVEKFSTEAKIENFQSFSQWLESSCDTLKISMADSYKLQLIAEEIFVNIASYAYPNSNGNIHSILSKNGGEITLQFIDSGIKYNPIEKPDPDINLDIKERPIGGLGIYMVKKSVDVMEYEYKDNKNILTLKIVYK